MHVDGVVYEYTTVKHIIHTYNKEKVRHQLKSKRQYEKKRQSTPQPIEVAQSPAAPAMSPANQPHWHIKIPKSLPHGIYDEQFQIK